MRDLPPLPAALTRMRTVIGIGTVLSKESDQDKYAELEVRSLTGFGAH